MTVAPDGVVDVTERLDLVFVGSYHGIHRDIPIEYPGPDGSHYTLFLQVTGVTDGAFPLKYDSTTLNGYRHLTIYIPGAVNTRRTVEIHCTVTNAVRWFDDHDELYWNVTGNDWQVPIESASTHIVFPTNASGKLRAQAFTGQYGSRAQDATVQVADNSVSVETNGPLSMREGLTADVYIPKGVLTRPSQPTQAIWFLRSNSIVLLPLWALLVMFFFWWTRGREPRSGISVAPMYEPPKGMTPAEVGTLIDDAVHPCHITATLVDLGVKGYLKIEEVANTSSSSRRDYIFHLLKPQPSDWASLAQHERVMLHGMFFAGGAGVEIQKYMKQAFDNLAQTPQFQAATNLQQVMKARAGQFGGFTNPEQVRTTMDGLFGSPAPDDTMDNPTDVHLSELNRFSVVLPVMKANILTGLKDKGMYSVDPRGVHLISGLRGMLFTFGGFILVQILMHVQGVVSVLGSPGLAFLSVIIAVAIVILFARIMTAKSKKGAGTKVEILGFQEFINRVDADRLNRMPPDTFEKFLPYAMALGIENRWAKAFQGIVQNPPNWHAGATPDTTFDPVLFTDWMHSMATDTHETFAAPPASSTGSFVAAPRASSTDSGWSSSSDSGGGDSGGGSGGGGGDAF